MNIQPELRIGDAEREAASSALGEHFAAGRLTREEYDERSDAVWSAKTNSDLWPLFSDLPSPAVARQRARTAPAPRRPSAPGPRDGRAGWAHRPRVGMPLLPLVLLFVVLLVTVTGAPWLLFILGWLWFAGYLGPRWHGRRHG